MKKQLLKERFQQLAGIKPLYITEQTSNPCQDFFDEMSPSMAGHWNPANGPIQPGSNTVPHGDVDCCEMYKGNFGPVFIGNANTNATQMNRMCTKAFNNITGQNFDEDTQEWAKCCRGEGITPTGDDPCEEFNAQTPQWQADCCKNPNCNYNPQCCPGGTTGTTTGTGTGTIGDREPMDVDRKPSAKRLKERKKLKKLIKKVLKEQYVGGYDPQMDQNGFVIPQSDQEGDANMDSLVNLADLTMVINHWMQSVSPGTSGDVVGSLDGFVDAQDLIKVVQNWLQTGATAPTDDNCSFYGIGCQPDMWPALPVWENEFKNNPIFSSPQGPCELLCQKKAEYESKCADPSITSVNYRNQIACKHQTVNYEMNAHNCVCGTYSSGDTYSANVDLDLMGTTNPFTSGQSFGYEGPVGPDAVCNFDNWPGASRWGDSFASEVANLSYGEGGPGNPLVHEFLCGKLEIWNKKLNISTHADHSNQLACKIMVGEEIRDNHGIDCSIEPDYGKPVDDIGDIEPSMDPGIDKSTYNPTGSPTIPGAFAGINPIK